MYHFQRQGFEQRLKGHPDLCTHTCSVMKYWNVFVEEGRGTQTASSTVEHKGLGDREMQTAPFQQGNSLGKISLFPFGAGKVWAKCTKTLFPGLRPKGKYCVSTAAIISSSVVMTAGIDQKEKITPEVSHINTKQAVMGESKRKGECDLIDTVLGDCVFPVLGAHQIALTRIIIKLSETSLQLCSEAGSAENILSHFQMTFCAQ